MASEATLDRLARQAARARDGLRRAAPGDRVAALRRYDGLLARLAEAAEVERPPLDDRSPAGRDRRRAEVERRLEAAGVHLRG